MALKVINEANSKIISLSDDDVIITNIFKGEDKNIPSGEYYEYEISFSSNGIEAIRRNNFLVSALVEPVSPIYSAPLPPKRVKASPKQVVSRLKNAQKTKEQMIVQRESSKTFQKKWDIDLSKNIPNDQVPQVLQGTDSSFGKQNHLALISSSLAETKLNKNIPIINGNLPESNSLNLNDGSRLLLLKQGKIPSKEIISVPHSAMNRFTGKIDNSKKSDFNNISYSRTSSEQLSDNFLIPVIGTKDNIYIKNTSKFILKNSQQLSTTFILTLRVKDINNNDVQIIKMPINHSAKKSQYRRVKTPPFISAQKTTGKHIINVKQMDQNANTIEIYAKELNSNVLSNKFTLIKKLHNITIKDGIQQFTLKTSQPTIYRASSNSTSLFNSCIVGNLGKIDNNEKIFAFQINNTIQVSILNINEAITKFVQILRRDVTSKEKEFSILHASIFENVTNSGKFIDETVDNDHVYEYSAVLYSRSGTPRNLPTTRAIRYLEPSKNSAISISHISQNSSAVSFNISVTTSVRSADILAKLYSKQYNADSQAVTSKDATAIIENQGLVQAAAVERINLTTGNITNLGLFSPGEFIDEGNIELKIDPPLIHNKYLYAATLYLRSRQQIVAELERSESYRSRNAGLTELFEVDGIEEDKDYNFKEKFYGPFIKHSGTISYAQALADNHPESVFSLGDVGHHTFSGEIGADPAQPIVSMAKVSNYKGIARLSWSMTGDKSDVDHFIIEARTFNGKYVIGTTHSNTLLEFYDDVHDKITGSIDYYIIPVLNNYETGTAFLAGTFIKV